VFRHLGFIFGQHSSQKQTGKNEYKSKWDGFRCLAFKDRTKVELMSKSGKPLTRYFPEVASAMSALRCKQCVIDGEIVIFLKDGSLSFSELLQRIHPASSRVLSLSKDFPGTFLVFDLLVDESGKALDDLILSERRKALESFAKKYFKTRSIKLSPATQSIRQAKSWISGAGGALDGVIAKALDLEYRSGKRDGMVKMKRLRTADCVVGGFRYASKGKKIGSLLLGLYDRKGLLNHVGFVAISGSKQTPELKAKLEKLIAPPGFTGKAPGGPSRWSTERSTQWKPLKPVLVVEVQYDHITDDRFRHGTRLLRWRPDKAPKQCTFEQLKTRKVSAGKIFG
jgi:ATP-dependent DNA ligase